LRAEDVREMALALHHYPKVVLSIVPQGKRELAVTGGSR
jgi:hypothetical protein